MIVATAGHIDHGKTTLVRALTGVDTDRLPEEKARGISIDIGFAHMTLDTGRTIGFVDVPGHERFVRNMLSGVYAVRHVLLVIAADDGVMPQTREHLSIVRLLGLADATAVITKADRVTAHRLAQVAGQARALLDSNGFPRAPVIAASAINGEGLDALRERLADVASADPDPGRRPGAIARFVVDRVFSATGSGTIATGTAVAGTIAAGDKLIVSPAGTHSRVRGLQRHGQAVDLAHAGERCAINLAGVERVEVARGDWVVAPEAHHPTDRIDVRVDVLAGESEPLEHWTPVHFHIGAADVPARLTLRRGASLAPGESGFAQLRLQSPIHAVNGDRFILRDQSARRTLGGGRVVDPFPPVRRRADRTPVLHALDGKDARPSLDALLDICTDGVRIEWLARVFGVAPAALLGLVPADAVVIDAGGPVAFAGRHVQQFQERALDRIRSFHAQHSGTAGIGFAQLHKEAGGALALDEFTALIKWVAPRAGIQARGSLLRLESHDATANPRDILAWQRVVPVLDDQAASIPSVRELAAMTGLSLHELRDLLHRKSAMGELSKLNSERFALPKTMAMLLDKARATAAGRANGLFTAAQFRDAIGTGRQLAIEILEHLDKLGATERKGDRRAIKKKG